MNAVYNPHHKRAGGRTPVEVKCDGRKPLVLGDVTEQLRAAELIAERPTQAQGLGSGTITVSAALFDEIVATLKAYRLKAEYTSQERGRTQAALRWIRN